jgi:hypothetical protein
MLSTAVYFDSAALNHERNAFAPRPGCAAHIDGSRQGIVTVSHPVLRFETFAASDVQMLGGRNYISKHLCHLFVRSRSPFTAIRIGLKVLL